MGSSRRRFLRSGSMFVVSAALTPAVAGAITSGSDRPERRPLPLPEVNNLDYFNRETFLPYLNTTFHVRLTSSVLVDLTLIKITNLKTKNASDSRKGARESFSLLFSHSGFTSPRKHVLYATRRSGFSEALVPLLDDAYQNDMTRRSGFSETSILLIDETYQIEHDALGKFALFLVAVGSSPRPQLYEAVVNRMDLFGINPFRGRVS